MKTSELPKDCLYLVGGPKNGEYAYFNPFMKELVFNTNGHIYLYKVDETEKVFKYIGTFNNYKEVHDAIASLPS